MLYMEPSAPLIQDEPIPSQMERQNPGISQDSMELVNLSVGNSDAEVSDKTSRQETVRKRINCDPRNVDFSITETQSATRGKKESGRLSTGFSSAQYSARCSVPPFRFTCFAFCFSFARRKK